MRRGILAWAAIACAALSSATAAAEGNWWPEEIVVPSVTVPTDPASDALGQGQATWSGIATAGLLLVDAAEDAGCALRTPVSGCGAAGHDPHEPPPFHPSLPMVGVDPSGLGLPSGVALAVPRAPGVAPIVVELPRIVVDPDAFAAGPAGPALAGAVPPSDAPAWQLAREALSAAAAAWPAGAASWIPAKVELQQVAIANPVPEPSTSLAGSALGGHASLRLASEAAAPRLPASEVATAGLAGAAALAPLPGPVPGAPMGLLLLPGEAPVAVGPPLEAAAEGPPPIVVAPSAWEQAGAAARMIAGTSLLLPAWALYRRVRASMALEQPQRRDIYERVVADPGLTPSDLRAATGLHYTTCVHHLRVLSQLGFVELRRLGGQVRCFENHRRYGEAESHALAAMRSPTAGKLLHIALERPGVTQAEAAKALGVTRSTVKHHVDRLVAWGVLLAEQDGGHVRLRLAPGAEGALRPRAPAPAPAPGPSLAPSGTAA